MRFGRHVSFVVAIALSIAAVGVLAWQTSVAPWVARDASTWWLSLILLVAAIGCSRRPITFGLSKVLVSLDSVPILLAAVFAPAPDAMIIAAAASIAALWKHERDPGWRGWFWAANAVTTSMLAVWVTHVVSGVLIHDAMTDPPRMFAALAVATMLELCFSIALVIELAAEAPSTLPMFVRGWAVSLTPIALSTIALVLLAPYVDGRLWIFTIALGGLLFVMYGGLWIANSQQLEKRRGENLRQTFSRYVPEGVVEDNYDTMKDVELGGEQHDVTVLFCDIRGFTGWSEQRDAVDVITQLNVLLSELSAAVMATGGTLDKFTGDGLMAFWGAPLTVADHTDRACRAALDMLHRLDRVNEQRAANQHEPFAIGIGVHSGGAVVGNVGHERRLDYTAIGDTVNLAARLEAATKDVGSMLLVSRDAIDRLSPALRARAHELGEVSVKGRQQPVEVWALHSETEDADGSRAA